MAVHNEMESSALPRRPARPARLVGLCIVALAVVLAGVVIVSRFMTPTSMLVAGYSHNCLMFSDGTVSCWGDPPTFGHDEENGKTTPVVISGLADAAFVSANTNTCAVHADGAVSCWGPSYSEVSSGGTRTQLTPTPLPGVAGAVKIALGVAHACVVSDEASVSCWGLNEYGQLGDGTTDAHAVTDIATSVPVQGATKVTAISAGSSHTCVVGKDRSVRCWGYNNNNGQLGDGTNTNRATAAPVASLPPVSAVSAGAWHTCALLNDRTVRCWGSNEAGQLGNGTTWSSSTGLPVVGLASVRAIAAGAGHTCAIQKDRTVVCWGNNEYGQLGNGTTTDSTVPVQVENLTGAVDIVAGASHTCAALRDHTVVCWGANGAGQLGTGTNTSSLVPVEVSALR